MLVQDFLAQEPIPYSDWFGTGDSHKDYYEAIALNSNIEPNQVYRDGHMLCLVWPDKIIMHGYDGGEYCHTFEFPFE